MLFGTVIKDLQNFNEERFYTEDYSMYQREKKIIFL